MLLSSIPTRLVSGLAVSALLGTGLAVMQDTTASACETPNAPRLMRAGAAGNCCQVTTIDITGSSSVRMPFPGIKTYRDGPGGTLTVSKTYSGSVSASITAGGSVEIGGVLAKAKVEVSGTLTQTNSTSETHTYSHNITSGKYGNAQYVSYGKNVKYRKLQYKTNCTYTVVQTGAINFPSSTEGWYYWETSS